MRTATESKATTAERNREVRERMLDLVLRVNHDGHYGGTVSAILSTADKFARYVLDGALDENLAPSHLRAESDGGPLVLFRPPYATSPRMMTLEAAIRAGYKPPRKPRADKGKKRTAKRGRPAKARK